MSALTSSAKKRKLNEEHGMLEDVDDLRIRKLVPLMSPAILLEEQPITGTLADFVKKTRKEVADIVNGKDDRLVCVVGPCSIHDPKAGVEYASRLRNLVQEHAKDLLIVMRVYFEKPRTTVGWKGLINDPELNGTYKINKGLRIARKLLMDINQMGIGCGCEFLDALTPQFYADLVSWGAIGARTTESQVHREIASGLSMPVGFKNGTSGDIQVAVDATRSARCPHSFLSITKQGVIAIVHTNGNKDSHVILRGGKTHTNYSAKEVVPAAALMKKNGVEPALIIDCSHGNSRKIHTNQPPVCADIASQVAGGSTAIKGIMAESNLVEGNQKLKPGVTVVHSLVYGKSVTDACVHLDDTAKMMANLAAAVRKRREVVAGKK